MEDFLLLISNFMPNFSSIQAAVLDINCDGRTEGRKDGSTELRKYGTEWIDSASQTPFRDTIRDFFIYNCFKFKIG